MLAYFKPAYLRQARIEHRSGVPRRPSVHFDGKENEDEARCDVYLYCCGPWASSLPFFRERMQGVRAHRVSVFPLPLLLCKQPLTLRMRLPGHDRKNNYNSEKERRSETDQQMIEGVVLNDS